MIFSILSFPALTAFKIGFSHTNKVLYQSYKYTGFGTFNDYLIDYTYFRKYEH